DVDFAEGVIRVSGQLYRTGDWVDYPKTDNGFREVVLAPSLAAELKKHKLASASSQAQDFVFCTRTGTGLGHRNVSRRGVDAAANRIGLNEGRQKFRFHDLRHVFASAQIAAGADPVFLCKQMGHSNPTVTYG